MSRRPLYSNALILISPGMGDFSAHICLVILALCIDLMHFDEIISIIRSTNGEDLSFEVKENAEDLKTVENNGL